jgi:epoxyqueuosine reductase
MSASIRATALKKRALSLGFNVARIARCDRPWTAGGDLEAFVAADRHGEMAWLKDTLERRSHPTRLWPEARSALVCGLNYGPAENPLEALERRQEGVISVYARNGDYHDLLKGRLKQLAQWFASQSGDAVKVFVDTAPLMEKPLAARAGLGWQGKHTNLVSRDFGSWLFLGVMLTDAELEEDPPETDHCGSCDACIRICPTGAITDPYRIDARACISYLTIEHKGPVPRQFRRAMGNRIYGCDDCLAICPWNKFAQRGRESALHPRPELKAPLLSELCALDDAGFREVFAGSPVKRIGRDRFIRNVLIAIGNSGSETLVASARARLGDCSPLVRGAAVWALAQLDRNAFLEERSVRAADEPDEAVRAEWSESDDV